MQQKVGWQIELLRMSFFFEMRERDKWNSFWEAITNNQTPDSAIEKPHLLQTTKEGTWYGHNLTVTLQSNRIDIFWKAIDVEEDVLPNLGEITNIDFFAKSINKALDNSTLSCIQRAAFGSILLAPAQNREDAYQLLAEYLPSIKISSNSRDFFYQINRPISSTARSNREINRISRWTAVQSTYVDIQNQSFNIMANACRLELDINTSHEKLYSEDDPITLEEILEFSKLALDIATKGDIEQN